MPQVHGGCRQPCMLHMRARFLRTFGKGVWTGSKAADAWPDLRQKILAAMQTHLDHVLKGSGGVVKCLQLVQS